MEFPFIQLRLLCERSSSKYVRNTLKNERRPQITKSMSHGSSNVKSRLYSKFEFKNSQKMRNKHLHMTVLF